MEKYPVLTGNDLSVLIDSLNLAGKYSQIIVLCDENTYRLCYPLVSPLLPENHRVIGILAGEVHKTLATCEKIWTALCEMNTDRSACLLNLGGGVVGDIGGFVAGTYKRGIAFVQIPTSLLAQVDASVGGKTGVDFLNYKNQIGLFARPESVLIYPGFLQTLPEREWKSGFAEILKHYLIADKPGWERIRNVSPETLDTEAEIRHSVAIKSAITEKDPHEKNIRKSLNFGHTVGHAIESYFIGFDQEQVLHGEAVAAGMICESFFSWQAGLITGEECMQITQYINQYFNIPEIPVFAYKTIFHCMAQDKKNYSGEIRTVLLSGIGNTVFDVSVSEESLLASMEYYQQQLQRHTIRIPAS
ncbi:MAG: 3-dehydroquinate synthase [Bacteroidia bacterium]|nr:3-dehydroquinate synthase [Bacteroidia bacterium]